MLTWLKPASTQRRVANWYINRFYRDVVEALEHQAALRPDTTVVEFGCDRGLLACYLRERCRLILADLSDRRETAASLECEFRAVRGEASGLSTASVDIIVMISVYHHLRDFDVFTQEAARILKPHGRLVLVEPVKHHPLTIFLNVLSRYIHGGDVNWTEPYGLALWLNRKFIAQKLAQGFHLSYRTSLDNFLWGLNPFIPQLCLRAYYAVQKVARVGNTELYIFEKTGR